MKTMKNLTILLFATITAFSLQAQSLAPALSDASDNGDGSYTNWFGTFSPEGTLANAGWINHDEHGRLYIDASGENLWAYDPNVAALGDAFHGWIYTNRDFFPYFYVEADPALYLIYVPGVPGPASTPRVFLTAGDLGTLFLPKATTDSIVDIAVAGEAFSSLETAVITAGLVDALSGEGPLTVFAPTDAAFGKLDPDTLNALLTDADQLPALTSILTYHVVPGRVTSGMLGLDLGAILSGEMFSGYVTTLGGADLRVDVTPFGILLNGSTMVTTPDVEASNGIIHVIDEVLLPPQDIVDTAINAGFSTLVTAVQAAGLEETLRGEGPFTVFAPTDEAFSAIPSETLNALLADPETLSNILLYHATSGKVYQSEVAVGEVPMANGDSATVSIGESGELLIDGATITATDIVTSNGVIHVIDAVILPPAE
jgi:uncharacterized surface protein with fasciclin (FAS1) repeats